MTQAQLDRAVARMTGESLREIRRRGFSLAIPEYDLPDRDAIDMPQVLDWDEVQQFEEPRRFHRPRNDRMAA